MCNFFGGRGGGGEGLVKDSVTRGRCLASGSYSETEAGE